MHGACRLEQESTDLSALQQGLDLPCERVALGPSHPCTTFDKWAWMAVLDDDDRVVDAITTQFG